MHEKIINRIIALHRYSFVRITRQTLIMIFPIVFIGTMAKMILKTVFKPDGFIYNIAFLDVIPQNVLRIIQFMLTSISQLTLGILGIYTVYMAAKFTAKRYRRDGKFAGIKQVCTVRETAGKGMNACYLRVHAEVTETEWIWKLKKRV